MTPEQNKALTNARAALAALEETLQADDPGKVLIDPALVRDWIKAAYLEGALEMAPHASDKFIDRQWSVSDAITYAREL
jgi:hypothetical protein